MRTLIWRLILAFRMYRHFRSYTWPRAWRAACDHTKSAWS